LPKISSSSYVFHPVAIDFSQLAGAGLIGLGVYSIVGGNIPNLPLVKTISIAVSVVGAVILFIAFFGCCGSIKV
jgi:hypothetical protein